MSNIVKLILKSIIFCCTAISYIILFIVIEQIIIKEEFNWELLIVILACISNTILYIDTK